MMKSRLLAAVGIVAVVGAGVLAAQTPVSPQPSFEVASVKVSAPNESPFTAIQSGGRFVSTRQPLVSSLAIAFGRDGEGVRRLDGFSGMPSWANDINFDIVAKTSAPDELPVKAAIISGELRPLLRSLLAERFKLRTHVEMRQLPIYNLVRTSTSPELALGLHRSTTDCSAPTASCAATLVYGNRPRLTARSATMQQIALVLPSALARPVKNLTDLGGRYDFVLQWSRAQDQPGDSRAVDPPDMPAEYVVPLVTALRDQLGLKIESATGPVDIVVIDHIEQPTPD